jgi:hypothetical protein
MTLPITRLAAANPLSISLCGLSQGEVNLMQRSALSLQPGANERAAQKPTRQLRASKRISLAQAKGGSPGASHCVEYVGARTAHIYAARSGAGAAYGFPTTKIGGVQSTAVKATKG